MIRWLPLFLIILANFVPFALPGDNLEVTELKGGSVMTDFPAASEMVQPPLKWFVINDPSSPIRLESAGIIVKQHHSDYSYASRGIATSSSGITEMEVEFILFDVRGANMKTLFRTEKVELGPGRSFLLDNLGPWKATVDEVQEYGASVSFVTRVRKSNGGEWVTDAKAMAREVQALKPKLAHKGTATSLP
jgi:hypothetical protein